MKSQYERVHPQSLNGWSGNDRVSRLMGGILVFVAAVRKLGVRNGQPHEARGSLMQFQLPADGPEGNKRIHLAARSPRRTQ